MERRQIEVAIAASLREFGYPDATEEMVSEVWTAFAAGSADIPHGIVGKFAEAQLEEIAAARPDIVRRP